MEIDLAHLSPEDLNKSPFDWRTFQSFAVSVVRRIYGSDTLRIIDTAVAGPDGGRDGEALVVFGSTAVDRVAFRLWVEVKHRTTSNPGHQEFGGHLFMAIVEAAHVVVLVTNTRFPKHFRSRFKAFCTRTGLQGRCIDGEELIKVAWSLNPTGAWQVSEQPGSKNYFKTTILDDQPAEAIECQSFFSLDATESSSYANLRLNGVRAGEIIFFLTDCDFPQTSTYHIRELRVEIAKNAPVELVQMPQVPVVPVFAGSMFRFVTTFRVLNPSSLVRDELHLDDVTILINGKPCKELGTAPSVIVDRAVLNDWIPPSRTRNLDRIVEVIDGWIGNVKSLPGIQALALRAIGGQGKTFLLNHARPFWLARGCLEISLHGDMQSSSMELLRAVVRSNFPVPLDILSPRNQDDLQVMLVGMGLSAESANLFASYLCDVNRFSDTEIDISQAAAFLSVMLAFLSETRPLVVFYEDLHKADASVLALLLATQKSLQRKRRGHVLFVLTTRYGAMESRARNAQELALWISTSIEYLDRFPGTTLIDIQPIQDEEVKAMLRSKIPGISENEVSLISGQVGNIPFHLIQALLYLEQSGPKPALEFNTSRNCWMITNRTRLAEIINDRDLRHATSRRIASLVDERGTGMRDFLTVGAIFGRKFKIEDGVAALLKATGTDQASSVDGWIKEARRRLILRRSRHDGRYIEFDHDLVRRGVIEVAGPYAHRRLARSALEVAERPDWETEGLHERQLAELAYQAGRVNECRSHALGYAQQAAKEERLADVAYAYDLALQVMEPSIFENVHKAVLGQGLARSWARDDAVDMAEPVGLPPGHVHDREVIMLLLDLLSAYAAFGGEGNKRVKSLIAEIEMLSRRQRGILCTWTEARLNQVIGACEFSRGDMATSSACHERAHEGFLQLIPHSEDLGAERERELPQLLVSNLIRLAIAQRENHDLVGSRHTLLKALRCARTNDRTIIEHASVLVHCLANYGATFFYTNWTRNRHFWALGERIANEYKLRNRYLHALIDLAHLDLLEGGKKLADARWRLDRARTIEKEIKAENSLLRIFLNGAIVEMLSDPWQPEIARDMLMQGDELGLLHGVERRVWRVHANLATLSFCEGNVEESAEWDRRVISVLSNSPRATTRLSNKYPTHGSRECLALANIALRAQMSKMHPLLLHAMPQKLLEVALNTASYVEEGRLNEMPGLRGAHCKVVNGYRQFVITE